jgi:DNA-binding SARP family transcriptional activator/TolB-like protein
VSSQAVIRRLDRSSRATDHAVVARIHLIGSLRATDYLGRNILPKGRKTRALYAYLAATDEDAVRRSRLAGLLWDRASEEQARTSLRQAVREIVETLGPAAGLLNVDRDTLGFSQSRCWVDRRVLTAAGGDEADEEVVDSLLGGRLLDDLGEVSAEFDGWLAGERARHDTLVRRLLEARVRRVTAQGAEPALRIQAAQRLLAFDPADERACRVLMAALVDSGERAAALREFELCKQALKRNLDLLPSRELLALRDAVRAYDRSPAGTHGAAAGPGPAPPLEPPRRHGDVHSRLRVGVLPFGALANVRDRSLPLALAQDVAGALSRFRWFDVIAGFCVQPGLAADEAPVQHVEDLRLDYAVDATLSGAARVITVAVRLLEMTDTARAVWSESFHLPEEKLASLSELVTARIVARIDPVILSIEGRRSFRPELSPAASLVLRAVPLMYSMERPKFEEAGRLLEQALQLDVNYAMAAAWRAYWHVFHMGQGWSNDSTETLRSAEALCVQAVRSDPENADALGIFAHCCAFLHHDFDSAQHYFERRSKRLSSGWRRLLRAAGPSTTRSLGGRAKTACAAIGRSPPLACPIRLIGSTVSASTPTVAWT